MSDGATPGFDRRSIIRAIGAAGGLAGLGGLASANPGRNPGPKKDEILVGVSPSVSDVESTVARDVPGKASVVHTNETLGYAAVRLPERASARAKSKVVEAMTEADDVEYAEPNATVQAFVVPDDPRYDDQYAPQQVNADDAWDTTFGDSDVTIAVVDQGIQYDHPALEANMDDSASNYGRDFADDDGDPYPDAADESHGTHVGGIAAGTTDDGTGHAGISDCSLLSARALDDGGGGSLSDVADAVQWAADQGADVINMSLGGGGYSETMDNACSYARDQGSLLVAAAGNDSGGSVSYPAALDSVVAVSALDENENLASYSNLGPEIDLAAPGSNVLSSVMGSDYSSFSGTSMASPVVAGVAGLALSAHSDLTNAELRTHLQETAVDVGLSSDAQGHGRVDAGNAVNTSPGDGGDGGDGGDDGDGQRETSASVSDSLSGWWDEDCWTYGWEYDETSELVLELEGPSDATFDLYANTGRDQCPTTSDYDHISYNWGSDEEIVVENPDTSTALHVLVDSYRGSGDYTLTVTERSG